MAGESYDFGSLCVSVVCIYVVRRSLPLLVRGCLKKMSSHIENRRYVLSFIAQKPSENVFGPLLNMLVDYRRSLKNSVPEATALKVVLSKSVTVGSLCRDRFRGLVRTRFDV
jgi:hypothetical protein